MADLGRVVKPAAADLGVRVVARAAAVKAAVKAAAVQTAETLAALGVVDE